MCWNTVWTTAVLLSKKTGIITPEGGAIPFRVESPVRDAGVYRVKAESVAGDHHCSTYSEPIEFIAPPSHDELTSLKYCDGKQLVLQLNSDVDGYVLLYFVEQKHLFRDDPCT